MLKLLLTKAEVDLAEDGLEAATLVLTDPLKYDVIFMDNLLPKMVYYWMWNDCLKSIFSRQLFYELEWRAWKRRRGFAKEGSGTLSLE